MRTLTRLALFGTGLLVGAALLRRWLEEQPGFEAPAQPAATATRKELYERARELGVEGRSKMNKQQLGDAVRRAETAAG
jgi:hypothetical protein